ncbi:hypothetical protein FGD67_21335 [Colwellia sp. M166]|uniref:hypothetical protein n=1 Tax=Colwellia sp. M166 TaxID=2583805 RepID=UPI00211DF51A|nr:hypothetical protein [Colwellia sp. M166]UUO25475.1 hypothetical protein FGD67_21335 [Colwellia sp. M166]
MSRVIHVKGKVFIENRKIAIDIIQEARNGIYFENNQFLFKRYDAYDQISERQKIREMEEVEQEYLKRFNLFQQEREGQNRIRTERNNRNQERLAALQRQNDKLEQEKRKAKLEQEKIEKLEMERLKIEEERKAIELEKEKMRIAEEKRIQEEKLEKERLAEEKRVLREEKAMLIIENAKKQGYKIKKELRKDNTIKLVLQQRSY